MKTQDFLIPFIVVHIIPAAEWDRLSYRRKKEYHHLITSMGKKVPLKPLQPPIACIEVAFIGGGTDAPEWGTLYTLLQDLWATHPKAEILYADELTERAGPGPIVTIARSLIQNLPGWIQRVLPRWNTLFTLRSLLPVIY